MIGIQARRAREMNTLFFKFYPWIGSYISTAANSRLKDHLERVFMIAACIVIFVLYSTHILLTKLTTRLLFPNNSTLPSGVSESFYGICMLVELYCTFFARTRESLHYLPKITTSLFMSYIIYLNLTMYGFYFEALFSLILLIIGVTGFFFVELESKTTRNPDENNPIVPSNYMPRALMQPFFSLT